MDNEKGKIRLVVVFIVLVLLGLCVMYVANNKSTSLIKNTNEDKTVVPEISNYTTKESETFCISGIEEVEDGYIISANLLDKKERIVSEEEYKNVINGKEIEFRGLKWKIDKNNSNDDYTYIKSGEKAIAIALNKADNERVFENAAGMRSGGLSDFSGKTIKFKAKKDVLIGTFFTVFKYDENGEIKCYSEDGKELDGTELTIEDLKSFSERNSGSYEECILFARNGLIDAIQIYDK